MTDLKWFLLYKVAEVSGVAAAVTLFMISAGGIESEIIAMWSLGIGLAVTTVDELAGGVTPSTPED